MRNLFVSLLAAGAVSEASLFIVNDISAQNVVTASMADVNGVIDNTPDSLDVARMARPVPGSTRHGDNPVLFLVGNSTMRAGTLGNGNSGQWGWGYFMPDFFDRTRISVENQALGGMSSRTFYNRLWPDVLTGIRPGDWVIIELGHNDNGPYDSGRARASIPGIGNDSLCVTIKETGVKETVYTYGEYMRRMIHDVKEHGAHPILFSLTPRNAWDDPDSTIITRVSGTFGLWARQVAEAEGVPFVDLNDITARKYERFGKEKVKSQMFYLDRIHTSEYGARINAESAADGLRHYPGLELASYMLPERVYALSGDVRSPGECKVYTVGLNEPGITPRSFIESGRWERVYRSLCPGDTVRIHFDERCNVDMSVDESRFMLPGFGDESKVYKLPASGRYRVVYTYGWYIRKMMQDAIERGAVPEVVCETEKTE